MKDLDALAEKMLAHGFEAFTLIRRNGEWQASLRKGSSVSTAAGATAGEALEWVLVVSQIDSVRVDVSVLAADEDIFA